MYGWGAIEGFLGLSSPRKYQYVPIMIFDACVVQEIDVGAHNALFLCANGTLVEWFDANAVFVLLEEIVPGYPIARSFGENKRVTSFSAKYVMRHVVVRTIPSENQTQNSLVIYILLGVVSATCIVLQCIVILGCVIVRWIRRRYKHQKKSFVLLHEDESNLEMIVRKFTKQSLTINFEELQDLALIGQGSQGVCSICCLLHCQVVFRAKWGTEMVAFKLFESKNVLCSEQDFGDFEHELGLQ